MFQNSMVRVLLMVKLKNIYYNLQNFKCQVIVGKHMNTNITKIIEFKRAC